MNAGADCATNLTGEITEMDLDEFIDFLEPNEETGKGGAIIMSAAHWNNLKTAIEDACKRLGSKCKVQKQLKLSAKNLKKLRQ